MDYDARTKVVAVPVRVRRLGARGALRQEHGGQRGLGPLPSVVVYNCCVDYGGSALRQEPGGQSAGPAAAAASALAGLQSSPFGRRGKSQYVGAVPGGLPLSPLPPPPAPIAAQHTRTLPGGPIRTGRGRRLGRSRAGGLTRRGLSAGWEQVCALPARQAFRPEVIGAIAIGGSLQLLHGLVHMEGAPTCSTGLSTMLPIETLLCIRFW